MDTDKIQQIDPKTRLIMIRDSIREAELKAGRPEGSVRLIGVTKFKTAEEIRPALEAGLAEIGENRAQEFTDKFEFFGSYGVKKHFIGALQTNKVKYLVGKADLIQSVDRPALAAEISRLAAARKVIQPILIEVNIGAEEQKSGVAPAELPGLLEMISAMPGIEVKGLMCVPPAGSEDEARPYFAAMRGLFLRMGELELPNVRMEELSMGMSGDYKAAICEGATMVRIGSAIFGPR
ncbi:MAG: YggS family pyridoxal phosphate-dependent enzyme, partial [Clostridia bacterium]|nr:YggS family pyridoxal phosphate-dependent enzyme [Clostridia bacterium]